MADKVGWNFEKKGSRVRTTVIREVERRGGEDFVCLLVE